MSNYLVLYEAMRRAAADSQVAAARTKRTVGYAMGGLAVALLGAFLVLQIGAHLARFIPSAAPFPATVSKVPPVAPHRDPTLLPGQKMPALARVSKPAKIGKHHARRIESSRHTSAAD
jgi:hypothetical protein